MNVFGNVKDEDNVNAEVLQARFPQPVR